MRKLTCYCFATGLLVLCSAAQATTFTFNTDPFAGTPVLNVPGRQVVGGELFINFNTATDQFVFDSAAFGVSGPVRFVNTTAGNVPATGVNVVVLETFDNDANPLTPFGASQAADLIANQVTTPGPGFFIYFNQSLNLPRLVFSTDLSSTSSDLRILARMLNLFGDTGRNQLENFAAGNFDIVTPASDAPEPSTFYMLTGAVMIAACRYARRKWAR